MNINNDIDTEILYTDPLTEKTYPAWLVEAVDQLLYKIRHKSIWDLCDFAIKIWAKKNPQEHKRWMKWNDEYRKSRKKETGATDSNSLRGLVNIPSDISYVLRKFGQHKIDDYPGGETQFWRDFVKRYPGFGASEKV